jgi:hypothetical protein
MTPLRVTLPFVPALLAGAAVPAALRARTGSSIETITVTVGVPHELAFTVSPSKITAPTAVFKVTNKGKLAHAFKLCTRPSTTDMANARTGVATKVLAPGETALLTVKLGGSGTYEYLSGTASQAASGMKGLVTVALGASTSGSGSSAPAGGSQPTSTTPSSIGGAGGGTGGVVNGQATDPACAPGTLVPVGPGAGDQDDDNEGGFPTDNDGCL